MSGAPPVFSIGLSIVRQGEVNVTATASQYTTGDVPCQMIYIAAHSANVGNIYIGGAGVTTANGSTDTTTGLELEPGDMVVLPLANMNQLWFVCIEANDDFNFLAFG